MNTASVGAKQLCRLLAAILMLALAQPLLARTAADDPHWSLGAIAISGSAFRHDVDDTLLLVPALGYEGRTVFLRGLVAGLRARPDPAVDMQLRLQPRMDRLHASDAPALAGIETRRRSVEAVGAVSVGPRWLRTHLSAGVDLLDRHGGTFAEFRVSAPVWIAGTIVSVDVAAVWQSASLNRYYHGVSDAEARPGRPAYRPGAGLAPRAGVRLIRPFADHWQLNVIARQTWLDSNVRSSPLVDRSSSWSALLGISRRF